MPPTRYTVIAHYANGVQEIRSYSRPTEDPRNVLNNIVNLLQRMALIRPDALPEVEVFLRFLLR